MADPVNNSYVQAFTKNLTDLRRSGAGKTGIAGLIAPNMQTVSAREAQLKNYLGSTDYSKQLEESQNMGKLQLALALAQRGFAAAGATPQRGESSVSTLSRELLSPLAGDAGSVAGRMMQQRQALKAAERQEDRQLKLSALQQITSEDAALRDLAQASIPKAGTGSGLLETPYYVLQKGQNGGWSFVPQAGGQGQMQVRQQKGTGAPYNIQTMTLQPLQQDQTIVKPSDLGKYGLGDPTGTKADTPNLQAGEFNLFNTDGSVYTATKGGKIRTPVYRVIVEGPNRGKFVELGTKTIFSQDDLETQGLSPRKITTVTAAAPKGVDDPKFKASFRGMVAQMGNAQELQGLGKTAIRFDPVKFAANPELKPGANYPFERVVGVNQSDGSVVTAPLEEDQQKTYADNLRAGYLNIFDAIKTGEEPANLNNTFIARELSKSSRALGIPAAGQLPAGVLRGREQITNPTEITAAYVAAVPGFATDLQGTLDSLPFGADNSNLRTGTGKLVLYNELGVDFGPSTVSPDPIAADSNAADVGERAANVRALDAGSIQDRILAENASKGTSMGSKLRTSTADSRPKQLAVVGEQLNAEKERLAKAMSSPGAAKDLQVLDKSLEMLTRLQRLDYDLKQSGVTGFIRGPAEGGLEKYLGISVSKYFRTDEGQKAAARFIQSLPVTQQLFARDILRQAGEQRFTNKDLDGAQDTLAKLGRSGEFNAGALRQLTGYLKSIVKSGLSNAGTFDISPATLEKAAMLGIDLKSITPKNNYYNPYFNQGKYAVTNQPVPQYSKQYMDGLRDNGIFGYAAMRGTTGNAPMYKLIEVDNSTGLPIPVDPNNPKKGFRTVTVSGAGDWKANLGPNKKKMLDFNRNYLLKTYGLDK